MSKNRVNSRQVKSRGIKSQHIDLEAVEAEHLRPSIITGKHLAPTSVDGTHIVPKSITDVHLDIDWAKKASEVLQTKLVVDYVQTAPVLVSSHTSVVTAAISAPVATTATEKGVIVDPPKNHVIIRAGYDVTQALHDEDGEEIKARITHDGTDFSLNFFTDKNGIETTYTFLVETSILFQYPQRFDFESVSEMFGANEKFVDYGIDVSTRYHIKQLVADIFGDGYVLGLDGLPTQATTLLKDILDNTLDIEVIQEDLLALVDGLSETDGIIKTLVYRVDAIDGDNGSIGAIFRQLNEMHEKTNLHRLELDGLVEQGGEFVDRITNLEQNPPRMRRIDKKFAESDLVPDLNFYSFDLPPEELPLLGDIDVYYNGSLLMKDVHYKELLYEDIDLGISYASGVEFLSRLILVDDIIQIRWIT